nr:apicidin f synthase [Quercus suber]
MLAINKAGGAWVPLDPSHPEGRHKQVIEQAGARLGLASPANIDKCRAMLEHVVEVSPALDKILTRIDWPNCTLFDGLASPSDVAYVLFTSGTTGVPKGIVMEHRSLCTSQVAISRRLGLEAERVRILQFAAYVFDLSIGEIVAPLISGACVCVPSEHERVNDLPGFVRRARVNWAFLTPSFVRLIQPEDMPSLELLLLAGEPARTDHLATWVGKVRLLNGWGPSETCCFSTLHEWQAADESPMTVGRPVGGYCWIVELDDCQQLAPVGCIGEVVIQGPTIAREYLAYPVGTAKSFITNMPAWAPKTGLDSYNRLYKSGDLAFYNPDGTIEFVSRQDTQVKIRGFRVELGDVEHHIRDNADGLRQVVVDIVEEVGGERGPSLVAFLCFTTATRVLNADPAGVDDSETCSDMLLPLDEVASHNMAALMSFLTVRLPSYMVPNVYVPVKYMPITTSQKTDRRGLRRAFDSICEEDLLRYMLANAVKESPVTEMEIRLRDLWATVLGLSVKTIGRNDSFLQLGGDSITAIRLVAEARRRGILLTISVLFMDPRLKQVAASAGTGEVAIEDNVEPWDLVPEAERSMIESNVRKQCQLLAVLPQAVFDVYPTTALQEALMALAIKQPGSYMARYTFELAVGVDLERFKQAWEQTVQACTSLRTRIVLINHCSWQAVINEEPQWGSAESLVAYLTQEKATPMGYGSTLCRYALILESGHQLFSLTMHHAIFDGWSLGLIMQTLTRFYDGDESSQVTLMPYVDFVRYAYSLQMSLANVYWRAQLNGATRPIFPRTQVTATTLTSRSFSHNISCASQPSLSITRATVLRAAWAIVLARYNDNVDDITFGATVVGRQAPVAGIERIVGPVISTVPVRVKLSSRQLITRYLHDIQTQGAEMIPFEQTGLQNIAKLGPDAHEACGFTTLLVIQPRAMFSDTSTTLLVTPSADVATAAQVDITTYFTYPLVVQCHLDDDEVALHFIYDMSILSPGQVKTMARQYEHVVHQLLSFQHEDMSAATLADVNVCGPNDNEQIVQWNASGPQLVTIEACVHDIFSRTASHLPEREAVFAWDGQCTYAELEQLSTRLAAHLQGLGVKIESLVPICFEKSMWTVVAMLAIMKAGAAFVPVNPDHPPARRRALITGLRAPLMLVSPDTVEICEGMGPTVVQVSATLFLTLPQPASCLMQAATPSNVAYVLFTSGSTGIPKGVVIEHRALSSSIEGHGSALGIRNTSRVLQFSSYVFDVCLTEIFTTLAVGGTVCVPSETTRLSDVTGFIRLARVYWAILTPSFVQSFDPVDVPSLKTLVLAGEAPTKGILETWITKLNLVNGYGPAETCIIASSHNFRQDEASAATIGCGCNATLWIVERDNHDRLAPVGCIGELLIQGPGLARGYLDDEWKTLHSFIHSPSWLPPGPFPRLYKTGDLARYNDDGTINYVGRKDLQVKIRGQRVEPGEVEHHVKQYLGSRFGASVQVVQGATVAGSAALVVFITRDRRDKTVTIDATEAILPQDENDMEMWRNLDYHLRTILPDYMVPTYFVPTPQLPLTSSGKVDGRYLRRAVLSLTAEDSQMILSVAEETIGRDDSFLQLGGDSIAAIRLVTAARRTGIQLTVSSIFKDPRLSQVAASAVINEVEIKGWLEPWSLVSEAERPFVENDIREQCGLLCAPASALSDVYPTTALQEGLMALSMKQPGSYMARHTFELAAGVDAERFKVAWEQTVLACAALRTRIVLSGGRSWQAVIHEKPRWGAAENLNSYLSQEKTMTMGYGSTLCRYALLLEGKHRLFDLTLHHAIFDGWSLGLVMQTLSHFFNGETSSEVALTPYVGFVNYALGLDSSLASEYWSAQLKGATRPVFPRPIATEALHNSQSFSLTIPFSSRSSSSATRATVLRAAWAIILAKYNDDANDVTFGAAVAGRQAPVAGIERMAGPVISTVPVRIKLPDHQPVAEFLYTVQMQGAEMIPFEQTGLQNIAKLAPDAHEACNFTTLLIIQPRAMLSDTSNSLLIAPSADVVTTDQVNLTTYFTYPLVVQCHLGDDEVILHLIYDSSTHHYGQIEIMARHFENVVQQLLSIQHDNIKATTLGDISVCGPHDIKQIAQWNGSGQQPITVEACVHDLISDTAASMPKQEAVFAWDGRCTYAELEQMSTSLAVHLCGLGVGVESLVPICFEKSMWTVVAMLAVMKAGAAFVPVNPDDPPARRRALVAGLCAPLMLASPATADICKDMKLTVVHVCASLVSTLSTPAGHIEQTVLPANRAAFVPVNPDDPPARRRALVAGLCAPLMLASPATADICKDMKLTVVHVCASLVSTLSTPAGHIEQTVLPANSAYVLFTSGSTGVPKGVVTEHRALASSIRCHGPVLGIESNSRVLQFSSYIFDVSLVEILTTLVAGGSVCVPSEEARLGKVTDFIALARVNWAILTPSYVQSLNAVDVPSLETLVLIGEAPSRATLDTWLGSVKVINAYGPAEASIISTTHVVRNAEASATTIGRGCNTVLWIVEPHDHNRLAPIGCIGELLIQGPGLAREYLNDGEKTARSFIQSPSWLPANFSTRLYKSGDLVRYNDNGTIEYIGRKDGQIKIRGQRVEPGEVEHYIKKRLPSLVQVAVTIVMTPFGSTLVAFVCINPHSRSQDCTILGMNSGLRQTFLALADQLAGELPAYMIPTYCVPLTTIPLTASGKADRNFLRNLLSGLSTEDMSTYSTKANTEYRAPADELESGLRLLWSRVLCVKEAEIGVDDNFYRLGGDSIKIVTLVELVKRQYGIPLSRDLLNSSRTTIHDIAAFIRDTGMEQGRKTRVDLLAEFSDMWKNVQMPDIASDDGCWTTSLTANANIFLTGGTGYLGTQILKQLVQHARISKIMVLVRGKDISHAFTRLIESARLAGWWRDDYKEKVQVWTGDLGQLGLGLTQDQWAILNGRSQNRRIDAIIHNGAAVEWTADYSTLRSANVDSTLQLLNIMLTSPAKPKLIYISGGVKVDVPNRRTGAEMLSDAIGYAQTKFMSEALVRECAARLPSTQNLLSTVKPGLIIGSPQQGIANTDDLIWRLVAGAARVGAYPIESSKHWVFVSDVDAITNTILDQLTLGSVDAFVDIDTGITVPDFWLTVSSALVSPIQPLTWEKWLAKARDDLERSGQAHPLWPVQQFLGQLGMPHQPNPATMNTNTERVKAALKSNVAYLSNVHFIGNGLQDSVLESSATFKRSKRPV